MKKFSRLWERYRSVLLLLFFLAAFITAVAGFLKTGVSWDNSIFSAISMFFLNYSDNPETIIINVARFLAAFFTISALFIIFLEGFKTLVNVFKGMQKGSVYIFGENDAANYLKQSVGFKAIFGVDHLVHADTYVLMNDEKANLDFLEEYEDVLKNKNVFIQSDSISHRLTNGGKHRYFSLEELCARAYWRNHSLIEEAYDEHHHGKEELSVVFLGFGRLGEALIYQATQTNIFDAGQTIRYHIFGDSNLFLATHTNLSELHIDTYQTPWFEHMDVLKKADRILILDDEQTISMTENILKVIFQGHIDVFTSIKLNEEVLLDHRCGKLSGVKLNIFNWKKDVCKKETIINEESVIKAKMLNANWCGEDTMEQAEKLWKEQTDTYVRYSNIGSVDYHTIQKRIITEWNKGKWKAAPWKQTDSQMEELAELEHIRWCNYHWYNNWTYQALDKNSNKSCTKDTQNRKHSDLIPYGELAQSEKQKDVKQLNFLFQNDPWVE